MRQDDYQRGYDDAMSERQADKDRIKELEDGIKYVVFSGGYESKEDTATFLNNLLKKDHP